MVAAEVLEEEKKKKLEEDLMQDNQQPDDEDIEAKKRKRKRPLVAAWTYKKTHEIHTFQITLSFRVSCFDGKCSYSFRISNMSAASFIVGIVLMALGLLSAVIGTILCYRIKVRNWSYLMLIVIRIGGVELRLRRPQREEGKKCLSG